MGFVKSLMIKLITVVSADRKLAAERFQGHGRAAPRCTVQHTVSISPSEFG
ncbi:MAG: hypothetical protein ABJY83_00340 [Roseibium sp.]